MALKAVMLLMDRELKRKVAGAGWRGEGRGGEVRMGRGGKDGEGRLEGGGERAGMVRCSRYASCGVAWEWHCVKLIFGFEKNVFCFFHYCLILFYG